MVSNFIDEFGINAVADITQPVWMPNLHVITRHLKRLPVVKWLDSIEGCDAICLCTIALNSTQLAEEWLQSGL